MVLLLDRVASRYHVRPSRLLRSSWIDWQIDSAVALVGMYVEGKQQERDKKGKPKWTIKQILNGEANRSRISIGDIMALAVASGQTQIDL